MKFVVVASMFVAASAKRPAGANEICIGNSAAFDLKWEMHDLNQGTVSPSTSEYPIDQERCMNISSIPGVKVGDLIFAKVHADLGIWHFVDVPVRFSPGSWLNPAKYNCYGTTGDYSCTTEGAEAVELAVEPVLGGIPPRPVGKICIKNDAGFDMYFDLMDLSQGLNSTHSYGPYPIEQFKCMEISAISGVQDGDIIYPKVQAIAGTSHYTSVPVIYKSGSAAIQYYTCRGTTDVYDCKTDGMVQGEAIV